jgi:ABC-2 type transport system ATP-binding protein
MTNEWMIRAHGIHKTFGELPAVDGVEFDVRRGEIFGLVGPDGAGKTTLLRLLMGILTPTAGAIEVVGVDMRRSPEMARQRIGYMSQQFSLYGELTVAENLVFFAELYGVTRAERVRREEELLGFSRLAPFRDRMAQHLSGGMRQKLALACTLIHAPDVLLLDEPTTGVDPVSRREFWKILYELLKRGVTLLVSTPYMDEAERCTRVALMSHGRFIDCAPPAELKAQITADLLEVVVTPVRQAKAALDGLSGVERVEVFGDRLHVWVSRSADGQAAIAARITAAGLGSPEIRPILPTLEDVFIARLTGGSA